MKRVTMKISLLGLMILCSILAYGQKDNLTVADSLKLKASLKATHSREDNNRNVMLNASNNTSPRDVNIGLPASVGGITILENDLPVVYFYWPELPNKTWRQSVGLSSTGLLKMEQVANSLGDLGFAVNSYSQTGTKDLKGKGKFTTNSFGWLQGDINISGPISKKGWAYTAGVFANFDPGPSELGFARDTDQAKILRAGITKYFNDNRGQITALYKYADAYNIGNSAVFRYTENGKVTELDNFRIGRDSYILNEGRVKMLNNLTGGYYWTGVTGRDNSTQSHNVDVFGNYLMDNGWNFKFSTRFHWAKTAASVLVPLGITDVSATDGYTAASNGQPYTGNMSTQLAMHTPATPITNIAGRFSFNKQIKDHNLTIGLLEQYYKVDQYTSNRSFYFQSVKPQPEKLLGTLTDSDGFYNYNVGTEYHSGIENKFSLYATDEWQVSDNFNLSYGLNLRHHLVDGEYSLTPREPGFVFRAGDFTGIKQNWFHIGGNINATYNISKSFGLLANFLYTEENRRLESYSLPFTPDTGKIKSPLGALGVFWNNSYMQLISQVTILKKNKYLSRYNLVNPDNTTEAQAVTVYYDIQTLGWTTDMLLNPFKGFSLHYMITFQNPIYKNFNFNAFGRDYNYGGNNVLGVSKVLMEIDPSYTYNKWKIWASFRYFSKQFANLTNVLYFAPRWETFGGISYDISKKINLGATVINFFNQRGASGTINGAELITDASPYYGRILSGSYIMPLTFQFTINFNF
ncbi:TonB-dependent receptor [Elizabethkingia bruuniana]|uniref:TonB-dependent receptor n=1 Tax=Elizabethkingia bruuniana TaxID=1756149 RepID=UPI00099AC03F|nr:TonB-dependent receptor [Elizabethkingia bruuniana]OPC66436.1 TonB-dependent receptor [Elizabethkingia bruuniana]